MNKKDEIIDFRQFFFKLTNNWYYFLISLAITFIVAFAYNRYSHELYEVNTALLIKEESDPSATSAAELLYNNNTRNTENTI